MVTNMKNNAGYGADFVHLTAQDNNGANSGHDVSATLAERGKRYGEFAGHAEVTQILKAIVQKRLKARNKFLAPDQQEALDMIFHKIGRIINGDANYDDSWIDIAGYAKLVADRLRKEQANTTSQAN